MDTQAIGPTSGTANAAPAQAPARPQATAVEKSVEAAKQDAKQAKEAQDTEATEVRTRDPRSLQYQVDKSTKQVVATIVDESNRLVIRQIPDAEVLRIAQAIDRMKGFLLEGKA